MAIVARSIMDPHRDPSVAASLARAATGPITVDITTTGRRSGMPQRIEIWIVEVGGRLVICGTPGPRGWLANLRADSAMTVHLKDELVVDVDFDAQEVTDPALRREIWTHAGTEWYRNQSGLDDLIADGPVVQLVPREERRLGAVR